MEDQLTISEKVRLVRQGEIPPVNESIRQIDNHSWLIGKRILLARGPAPGPGPSWTGSNGSFYTISDAPDPLPPSEPLPADSHFRLVNDAGRASAVWIINGAVCKVRFLEPGTTREHITMEWLRQRPLSFAIADVIYHTEVDGRYYIFQRQLPGVTLAQAWPGMDEETKQYYVSRIVGVCKELAEWEGDGVCCVDGGYLSEYYLTSSTGRSDHSPAGLLSSCEESGMDCSKFVFSHCDLGPVNIIVDVAEKSLGIIDWETAGFVPKEWIRTKFRVSPGLDLDFPWEEMEKRTEWRRRVQRQLGEEGFADVVDRWVEWRKRGS